MAIEAGAGSTSPRPACAAAARSLEADRKSTRLNSSHVKNSYAVFRSKKKSQKMKDQEYAQNDMLAYPQNESTARFATTIETSNLSKQHQRSETMPHMLTQATTAGQDF